MSESRRKAAEREQFDPRDKRAAGEWRLFPTRQCRTWQLSSQLLRLDCEALTLLHRRKEANEPEIGKKQIFDEREALQSSLGRLQNKNEFDWGQGRKRGGEGKVKGEERGASVLGSGGGGVELGGGQDGDRVLRALWKGGPKA